MPWQYREIVGRDVPQVGDDQFQLKYLNEGLSPKEAKASAKIEVADSDSGPARGIIFWNSNPPAAPPALPPGAAWYHERHSTRRDYERDLYVKILAKLNSLNDRSPTSAYHAKVFFTNRSFGDAYMSIYWPE